MGYDWGLVPSLAAVLVPIIGSCGAVICALWRQVGRVREEARAAADLAKEARACNVDAVAMESLRNEIELLKTDWVSQREKLRSIAGQMDRAAQIAQGKHKGGPNAKHTSPAPDEPLWMALERKDTNARIR